MRNPAAQDGRHSLVNRVGCQELGGKTVLLGDDLVVCKSLCGRDLVILGGLLK